MVRTQLACGTGRRCAFEIEITGTLEKVVEHRLVFGQVQPAVQRGEERRRLPVEQRERIIVEMEVQEVEFLVVTFLADAFQHHHVQRIGVANRAVETQRLRPGRVEFRRGPRIAAGEQGDVMSQRTSSSVSQCTTRSVPPYSLGGTASVSGATCAMRISRLLFCHACEQKPWPIVGTGMPYSGNVLASAKFL